MVAQRIDVYKAGFLMWFWSFHVGLIGYSGAGVTRKSAIRQAKREALKAHRKEYPEHVFLEVD